MADTPDIIASVAGSVASIAVFASFIFTDSKVRLMIDLVVEVAFIVFLVLAVANFSDDMAPFPWHVKTAVGLIYTGAIVSVAVFGITAALSVWRSRNDPTVRKISYRLSQTAWFVFILSSLPAFFVYAITEEDETYSLLLTPDGAELLVFLTSTVVSVFIIAMHCICACAACCCRRGKNWYRWSDTSAYDQRTVSVLMILAAMLLLIYSGLLAFRRVISEEPGYVDDEDTLHSYRGMAALSVDVLAAGLHRMSLAEYERDFGQGKDEAQEEEDPASPNAPSSPPIPYRIPEVPPGDGSASGTAATSGSSGSASAQAELDTSQTNTKPVAPPTEPGADTSKNGWKATRAEDGRVYCHHEATGETSWDWPPTPRASQEAADPPEPATVQRVQATATAVAPEASPAGQLAPGWAESKAEDGLPYYYRLQSGRTSWAFPRR